MGKKFFIERVFDLSDPYNLETYFQFQITRNQFSVSDHDKKRAEIFQLLNINPSSLDDHALVSRPTLIHILH